MLSWITTHLCLEAAQSFPGWSNLRCHTEGRSRWLCCSWWWPWHRKGGMCHCWVSASWNACHQLGCSPKRRPRTRCSIAFITGQKEFWSEDNHGGACFQWGGPNSIEELPKFHSPPRCPLSALHAQRGEWGSTTLHSAKGTLDCCLKWVSLRCGTSRPWPYSILAMFLVAWNGQTDETNY